MLFCVVLLLLFIAFLSLVSLSVPVSASYALAFACCISPGQLVPWTTISPTGCSNDLCNKYFPDKTGIMVDKVPAISLKEAIGVWKEVSESSASRDPIVLSKRDYDMHYDPDGEQAHLWGPLIASRITKCEKINRMNDMVKSCGLAPPLPTDLKASTEKAKKSVTIWDVAMKKASADKEIIKQRDEYKAVLREIEELEDELEAAEEAYEMIEDQAATADSTSVSYKGDGTYAGVDKNKMKKLQSAREKLTKMDQTNTRRPQTLLETQQHGAHQTQMEKASKLRSRQRMQHAQGLASSLSTSSFNPYENFLWPRSTLHYRFTNPNGRSDREWNSLQQATVKSMRDLERHTCLFFDPSVPPAGVSSFDIFAQQSGSASNGLGYLADINMYIVIAAHQLNTGTITHELIHRIGFDHTQKRADRMPDNVEYNRDACIADYLPGGRDHGTTCLNPRESHRDKCRPAARRLTRAAIREHVSHFGIDIPAAAPAGTHPNELSPAEELDCAQKICAWHWQNQYDPVMASFAAPYDHSSIMHYTFGPCLTDLRPWYRALVSKEPGSGNRKKATHQDRMAIRQVYQCIRITVRRGWRRVRLWVSNGGAQAWTAEMIKKAAGRRWRMMDSQAAALTLQSTPIPGSPAVTFPNNHVVGTVLGGVTIGQGVVGSTLILI